MAEPASGAAAGASGLRLLFVCMGNICRSPTAHGVMRHKVREAGWAGRVLVDSAGTHGWHAGEPPDERSVAHARQRGYDIADLRSRQLREGDFAQFDLLLVMDERNLADARDLGPTRHHGKLRLLTGFGVRHRAPSVPDPYYGSARGFEHVLDLIEDACDGLIEHVRRELGRPQGG